MTAYVTRFPVTGWLDVILTTHEPQPPSRHINFVPDKFVNLRTNVFKEVAIGKLFGFTKNLQNINKLKYYIIMWSVLL